MEPDRYVVQEVSFVGISSDVQSDLVCGYWRTGLSLTYGS